MEDALSSALSFLPIVETCCFCIKNIKIGAVISSIILFPFHAGAGLSLLAIITYIHKGSALAIIQAIVAYIDLVMSLMAFVLNVIVFFTFCVEMRVVWGLLFVLLSLVRIALNVVYNLLVLIRAFVDPGLIPVPALNKTKCPRASIEDLANETCTDLVYYDYVMFVPSLLWFVLLVYLIIVIYSYYKQDESE